jgi:hypothetical protein
MDYSPGGVLAYETSIRIDRRGRRIPGVEPLRKWHEISGNLVLPHFLGLALRELAENWWLLLRGIAAITFGLLALLWPGLTLLILVFMWGIYAIVDGIIALWAAIASKGGPILSRIRSEVTSRSNWAKDKSTLRVNRPIEVVVLNCWVTETNETLWASNSSTSFAKSASDLVNRSTL